MTGLRAGRLLTGRFSLGLCLLAGCVACWPGVASAAEGLPDGRVFEMVTPSPNHEANVYIPYSVAEGIFNAGEGGTHTKLPFQVAPGGGAVAYVANATVGGIGNGGAGLGSEYVAARAVGGGWSQVGLQPAGRKDVFYQAFSSDLSVGFLNAGANEPEVAPLSAEAPDGGYPVLYSHGTSSPSDSGYQPLFTAIPTEPVEEFRSYDVPLNFPKVGEQQVVFAGASTGLGESLFEVHGVLAAGAVDAPEANNLYVSSGGGVSLVNVLPSGVSEANATFGAPRLASGRAEDPPNFEGVVSGDGSRIFWTDLNTAVSVEDPAGVSRLFVREDPTSAGARTVQVDASQGPGASGGGRFWSANSDGSRVLFTDESQLTENSTAASGAPDLYEYEVETGHLVDLSVDAHAGESAGVQGVVGASEDGSHVYFVAQGLLAANENSEGKEAVAGGDNLYALQVGGAARFIATLSSRDDVKATYVTPNNGLFGDWEPGLGHRTAEVTPDGLNVVFESDSQAVEGYSPEVEGTKLEEVYDWDVQGEHLFCVSCSPDHSPPPVDNETAEGHLGAFLPPSWSFTYRPTWVSADGDRVFFDSAEPLVAADTDGTQDVYEWEREGSGGCTVARGCVYLLSGGGNESASWLIGSSASGDDVFLISRAELTPEDGNELYDVFDARVGGVQPVTPPACSGTGCQGVPAPPPVFSTPASETFGGVGNFPPTTKPVVVAKKPKKHKKAKKKGKRRAKAKRKTAKAKVKSVGRRGR